MGIFKIGDIVRVKQAGGATGLTDYMITQIEANGHNCRIRETGVAPNGKLYGEQNFDTSLLVHAVVTDHLLPRPDMTAPLTEALITLKEKFGGGSKRRSTVKDMGDLHRMSGDYNRETRMLIKRMDQYIAKNYGQRCADTELECAVCKAWRLRDAFENYIR
jgi:hypothetical protein